MWFGTQAGLNRYDGQSWTIYGVRQGLTSDWINAIAEDSSGRLWLATLGGVSYWDGRRFTNFTRADGLPDNRIVAIAAAQDGSIWCATPRGAGRFDGRQWKAYTTAEGLPASEVTALLLDSEDTLWAGTSAGLAFLRNGHFAVSPHQEVQGKRIRILAEGRDRRLWLGDDECVRVYRGRRLEKVFALNNESIAAPAAALIVDHYGVAWIGTPQGLGNTSNGSIRCLGPANGLLYNDVRSLFEDREGMLWIGTYGGLYKFPGRAFTNYSAVDGLGADSVRNVLRDRKAFLWVGTSGGLSRFDGQQWHNFTARDGLADEAVQALMEDHAGNLWIGTRTGITVFDGIRFVRDRSLSQYGRIVAIAEDPSNSIWCAVQPGGLFKRTGGEYVPVKVERQAFSNARLLVDRHGNIWASGDNGLSRWDGRSWRTYRTEHGLAANQPYYLFGDATGRIWFGYHSSHGFSSFDGHRFQHYTSADGLSNDAVYSLGADRQGNIWVGTARGVDRFNGKTFTNFGTEEGYADNESNAGGFFADADGTLWFGTIGGLSHYDPHYDLTAGPAPLIALTELHLGNRTFSPLETPQVGYQLNDFMAQVAGLSYLNEKKLNCQYRLVGFQDAWLPMPAQEIRINNLPAGHYTFEVRASKYQGPWSNTSQFGFAIKSPLWAQWWFWLLAAGILSLLIYGGFRMQNAHVRRRAEELERKVAKRTKELAEKTEELESFIYTVSHDLKAPVVSLQGMASLLKLDLAHQLEGDAALYLDRIHANTLHMQRLISELLKLSRIGRIKEERQPVDMKELVRETVNDLRGQIELKKAMINIAHNLPTVTCERERIHQVWMNLLANAINYSRPDTPPVVEIGSQNGRPGFQTFFMQDNGIGIPKEYHEKVFDIFYRVNGKYADSESTGVGLAIVKRIINTHGGSIWVESEGTGKGSVFWFTLPK
jgi:ligand-binding sensor domain-containing protein/signal transduction histidine kinase